MAILRPGSTLANGPDIACRTVSHTGVFVREGNILGCLSGGRVIYWGVCQGEGNILGCLSGGRVIY